MSTLKICFVQVTSPEIYEYSMYSTKLNQKYCELHNYDYKELSVVKTEDYAPQWSKIFHAIALLKTNQYTHLFCLDADAIVLNRSIKLESIISKMKTPIAFSENGKNGGEFINTGAFIATPDAIKILEKCIELSQEEMKYNKLNYWHEQTIITQMYADGVEMDIFPMNEMNSYWLYNINSNDGQFIYHFMGRSMKLKISIAKYLFEKFNF